MKFKILGGKIVDEASFMKSKHVGSDHKLIAITHSFGTVTMLNYRGGWGGEALMDIGDKIKNEIDTFTIVTDENKVNFTGALGWGVVGGVLTGGIGLLAGALLGGRGKSTLFAIKFKDGTQFLCEGKSKDVAKFQMNIGQF